VNRGYQGSCQSTGRPSSPTERASSIRLTAAGAAAGTESSQTLPIDAQAITVRALECKGGNPGRWHRHAPARGDPSQAETHGPDRRSADHPAHHGALCHSTARPNEYRSSVSRGIALMEGSSADAAAIEATVEVELADGHADGPLVASNNPTHPAIKAAGRPTAHAAAGVEASW
jgi:hypothetical protein